MLVSLHARRDHFNMPRYHILNLGFAILFYATFNVRPLMAKSQRANHFEEPVNRTELVRKPEDYLVYYQGQDGTPGIDFPIHSNIPRTTFSCKGIDSGYYADLDTDCQVFHICEEEKKISFLCPNGTIFQQSDLICEWWFKVNCTDAPNLYAESAEHLRQDISRRKALRKHALTGHETNHGAVMRTEEGVSVSVSRNGKQTVSPGYQQQSTTKTVSFNSDRNANTRRRTRVKVSSSVDNLVGTPTVINQIVSDDKNSANPQTVSHSKTRRYNDGQTGNFLNSNYQANNNNGIKTITTSNAFKSEAVENKEQSLKPYHVQFSSKNSGSDESQNKNYRGKIKHTTPSSFSNENEGSYNSKAKQDYDLPFPTHQFESSTASSALRTTRKSSNSYSFGRLSTNSDTSDSEEFQTEESASFVKNRFNSLQNDFGKSTANHYPNHRTTYSDLKQPNYTPSKSTNAISSVTPQYITTQSINNGKPFVGSRVGANIQTNIGTVPSQYNSTNRNYLENNPNDKSKHDIVVETVSGKTSDSFSIQASVNPFELSTERPQTPPGYDEESKRTAKLLLSKVKISSPGQFEVTANPLSITPIYESPNGLSTLINRDEKGRENYSTGRTSNPISESGYNQQLFVSSTFPTSTYLPIATSTYSPTEQTTRKVDHATVYGYSKEAPTTPSSSTTEHIIPVSINNHVEKITIHLSKNLNGHTSSRSNIKQVTFKTDEVPVSYEKSPKGNRVEIISSVSQTSSTAGEDDNKVRISGSIPTSSPRPYSSAGKSSTFSTTERTLTRFQSPGSAYIPITFSNDGEKYKSSVKPPLLTITSTIKQSDIKNINKHTPGTGFFVTRDSDYEASNNRFRDPIISTTTPISSTSASYRVERTTLRPRPFEKFSYSSSLDVNENTVTPTYSNYKISSASPFKLPEDESTLFTPEPTLPTAFTTAIPFKQNVDNMMKVLMKIAHQNDKDYSSETPRPGLVIPPSVGPQTLHTLAAYFANALDGIVADKEKLSEGELDSDMEDKLNSLLTEMTVHGYSNLFRQNDQGSIDQTTTTSPNESVDNGLEPQDSKNLVESPQIRELAKNFSLALSSYLHNPEMFRKELAEFRPTEPPLLKELDESTTTGDEELLNFSDADSKSSYSPIFPTASPSPTYAAPPSPTWGYILATQGDNNLDIKNSLNPDLNTADSQSFIPGFNNININNNYVKDKPNKFKKLPEDHWTTSPSATKLWKNTLSVNPIVVNDQFGTTPSIQISESESTESTEVTASENLPILDVPSGDIHYEVRSLPKVALNSTQIHGILIDFMNASSPDSEKLHRILRKLNTTEEDFLNKMKEIESNPLTKRLILLLISECGENAAKEIESANSSEFLEVSSSSSGFSNESGAPHSKEHQAPNSYIPKLVNPTLSEDDQDIRALQLLNSLYSIASKFGK